MAHSNQLTGILQLSSEWKQQYAYVFNHSLQHTINISVQIKTSPHIACKP